MNPIDLFLNNITQYRLMLYYLVVLVFWAGVFSFLGRMPFSPFALLLSTVIVVAVSWGTNTFLARLFKAPTNLESVYITSLILVLIFTPSQDPSRLGLLGLAAVIASASKFLLTVNKKHLFNPTSLAVFLTAVIFNGSASWWVGTPVMLVPVLIGGLLVVRKVQKFDLVFSFLFFSILSILGTGLLQISVLLPTVTSIFFNLPTLFFAFVMLVEPLTSPSTRKLKVIYGAIVGLLFSTQLPGLPFYSTPDVALLVGNLFTYLVTPKDKLFLKLKERVQLAPSIYEFVLVPKGKFTYQPGQYMEWTLGYPNPDSRGNRRYFTIASSPTEENLRIGVKFYQNSSSYKKALLQIDSKKLVASQLSGEFTLPKDQHQKLVFIAGGIGVTPFRSMIKYLMDKGEKRDIVLFYANNTAEEIVYKNIFTEAGKKTGLKTIYTLTETKLVPKSWTGKTGFINEEVLKQELGDYQDRLFYLSGPHSMVAAFEKVLSGMGVPKAKIKVDFFPGYA